MKNKCILFSSVIAGSIIITLIPYFIQFHSGLSDSQEVFSNFGGYLGGVLAPILSFITIIILISTLRIQKNELQIAKNESKKKDLFDVLKNIDVFLEKFVMDKGDINIKIIDSNKVTLIVKCKLLYRFLYQLKSLDKRSPILEYFIIKYALFIDTLENCYKEENSLKEDMKVILIFFRNNITDFNNQ